MDDPFSLVPLAVAAGGGRVDGLEAAGLIAAGITLLQRCAPLVRALSGRDTAVLLPSGPAFLTALAAADGRVAHLFASDTPEAELARALTPAQIGAVFTVTALAHRLPPDLPRVLLDHVPRAARVVTADRDIKVDLGSHHGLDLVGDTATLGRDEPWVALGAEASNHGFASVTVRTHRDELAAARALAAAVGLTPVDRTLCVVPFAHPLGLRAGALAPLLAGGHVHTAEQATLAIVLALLISESITTLVANASQLAALAEAWPAVDSDSAPERRANVTLRRVLTWGAPPDDTTFAYFAHRTGLSPIRIG